MDNNQKIYTREEEDAAMKVIMDQIAKEERLNLIEYYISVSALGLIMLGLGFMLGSVFV